MEIDCARTCTADPILRRHGRIPGRSATARRSERSTTRASTGLGNGRRRRCARRATRFRRGRSPPSTRDARSSRSGSRRTTCSSRRSTTTASASPARTRSGRAYYRDVDERAGAQDRVTHAHPGLLKMGDFAACSFVYDFAEPAERRPRAARRQGGRARGDDRSSASPSRRASRSRPRPARVHAQRRRSRTGSRARSTSTCAARGARRQALRRSGRSAARLGALGRGGLDARDDGHDPQPRPERRGGRGARARDRQPALRLRRVPAADPDVRRGRRRASTRTASSTRSTALKGERGVRAGRRSRPRTTSRARRDATRRSTARSRRASSRRIRACQLERAVARRVRLVGHAARAGLPARARDPRRPRHGGQRRPDGLRQQGRQLRHRRLLHARPVDRRAGRLRRVPRQRAGRGRRRRHPHAASRSRAMATRAARGLRRSSIETMQRLEQHYRDDAGHRVHGRGRSSSTSSRRARQAHGGGRAADRGRHGRRGPDLARGGGRAHRRRASSTSSCIR